MFPRAPLSPDTPEISTFDDLVEHCRTHCPRLFGETWDLHPGIWQRRNTELSEGDRIEAIARCIALCSSFQRLESLELRSISSNIDPSSTFVRHAYPWNELVVEMERGEPSFSFIGFGSMVISFIRFARSSFFS
jgi:hypothetical protein